MFYLVPPLVVIEAHYLFGETQGYRLGRCYDYASSYLLSEMTDVYGRLYHGFDWISPIAPGEVVACSARRASWNA